MCACAQAQVCVHVQGAVHVCASAGVRMCVCHQAGCGKAGCRAQALAVGKQAPDESGAQGAANTAENTQAVSPPLHQMEKETHWSKRCNEVGLLATEFLEAYKRILLHCLAERGAGAAKPCSLVPKAGPARRREGVHPFLSFPFELLLRPQNLSFFKVSHFEHVS